MKTRAQTQDQTKYFASRVSLHFKKYIIGLLRNELVKDADGILIGKTSITTRRSDRLFWKDFKIPQLSIHVRLSLDLAAVDGFEFQLFIENQL